MRRIGVIVAMEEERQMLLGAWIGGIGNSKVCDVRLSGIGKVNAALCTAEMISTQNLDCIVNVGVSGSIKPGVNVGDIVIGERTAYHDVWCGEGNPMGMIQGLPHFFEADRLLLAQAKSAAASFEGQAMKIHCGLLVSGDQFYISSQEDARISRLYPEALACDMESAAIAQTCLKYKVPFISIRTVSDVHHCDEAQRLSYENFWKESRESHFQYLRQFLSQC